MSGSGNEKLMRTKEEIQKKYELYYNKWRDYDLLTSILSMLGLIVGIIDVREGFQIIIHFNSMNMAWQCMDITQTVQFNKTLL